MKEKKKEVSEDIKKARGYWNSLPKEHRKIWFPPTLFESTEETRTVGFLRNIRRCGGTYTADWHQYEHPGGISGSAVKALKELYEKDYVDLKEDRKNQKVTYTLNEKGIKYLARYQHNKEHPIKKSDLVSKAFASILIVLGFVSMISPDFKNTGNVIGNLTGADVTFFLSLGLMVLGGFLLFKSSKE